MARLQDLLAKRETLDREIAETQKKDRSAAVAHIATIMEQYGLKAADLSGVKTAAPTEATTTGKRRGRPPGRTAGASTATPKSAGRKRSSTMKGQKVAPKFRNKGTGETWSGRGLQPRWLTAAIGTGKKLADFAV